MANNNTILSHEGKIHGQLRFPYAVYMGRIPHFLKGYPLHWHEEFEIICVTDGTVQIQVLSEKYNCVQGDIVLIPPGAVHKIQQIQEKSCVYYNILFKLSLLENDEEGYMFKKYFEPLIIENQLIHYLPSGCELNDEVYPIINRLLVSREKKYLNQELVIKAHLFMLIEKLQFAIKKDFPSSWNAPQISRLKPVLTMISEKYAQDITVDDAANLCAMSQTYFMKFFKKMTGMTFVEYLTSVRMEQAQRLLKTSSDSVSQIAEECGFHNFSYFIRSFKKHFGVTPNQART